MAVSEFNHAPSVITEVLQSKNLQIGSDGTANVNLTFNKRRGYKTRIIGIFANQDGTSSAGGFQGILPYTYWGDYSDGNSDGTQTLGVSLRNTWIGATARFTLNVVLMYYR